MQPQPQVMPLKPRNTLALRRGKGNLSLEPDVVKSSRQIVNDENREDDTMTNEEFDKLFTGQEQKSESVVTAKVTHVERIRTQFPR